MDADKIHELYLLSAKIAKHRVSTFVGGGCAQQSLDTLAFRIGKGKAFKDIHCLSQTGAVSRSNVSTGDPILPASDLRNACASRAEIVGIEKLARIGRSDF